MAVLDAYEHDMLGQIRWQGRKMGVPLSQLNTLNAPLDARQPTQLSRDPPVRSEAHLVFYVGK
jgi:hypothetical protein